MTTTPSSVLGPLRTVRVTPAVLDPAIDLDSSEYIAFIQTRDETKLKFHEGQKPDWFILQPISKRSMMFGIDAEQNPAHRRMMAFRSACHEIQCGDGTVMRADTYGPIQNGLSKLEWVDAVADRFGVEAVYEMADVAMSRARAASGKAPAYGLPVV